MSSKGNSVGEFRMNISLLTIGIFRIWRKISAFCSETKLSSIQFTVALTTTESFDSRTVFLPFPRAIQPPTETPTILSVVCSEKYKSMLHYPTLDGQTSDELLRESIDFRQK